MQLLRYSVHANDTTLVAATENKSPSFFFSFSYFFGSMALSCYVD